MWKRTLSILYWDDLITHYINSFILFKCRKNEYKNTAEPTKVENFFKTKYQERNFKRISVNRSTTKILLTEWSEILSSNIEYQSKHIDIGFYKSSIHRNIETYTIVVQLLISTENINLIISIKFKISKVSIVLKSILNTKWCKMAYIMCFWFSNFLYHII